MPERMRQFHQKNFIFSIVVKATNLCEVLDKMNCLNCRLPKFRHNYRLNVRLWGKLASLCRNLYFCVAEMYAFRRLADDKFSLPFGWKIRSDRKQSVKAAY